MVNSFGDYATEAEATEAAQNYLDATIRHDSMEQDFFGGNSDTSYDEGSYAQALSQGNGDEWKAAEQKPTTIRTYGDGDNEGGDGYVVSQPAQKASEPNFKVATVEGFEPTTGIFLQVGTPVRLRETQTGNGEQFYSWADDTVAFVDKYGNHTVRRADGTLVQAGAILFHSDSGISTRLDAVMTAGEVCAKYGLSESAVRTAIHRNTIPARKSGETWLVLRADAEARWGNR